MKRDEHIGAVFDALADPTRRRVVRHLTEHGPATPTEIAEHVPVSRQAISKHLAALGDAGLVAVVRDGREARYRLTPAPLTDAMRWMADTGAEWDDRLEALQRHLRKG